MPAKVFIKWLSGLCASVVLSALLCLRGAAQPTQNPAEVALAREQFTTGVEAARRGMWAEARTAFERSYALYAHPETLFNIAGARLKVGALVGAAEAYRGYVRIVSSSADPARVAQAKAALEQIEPRISHVTVQVEGLKNADTLLLDQMTLSRATLGVDLPVDPGAHEIAVMRGETRVAERTFTLGEGERIRLELDARGEDQTMVASVPTPREAAERADTSGAMSPSTTPRNDDTARPLRRSPWLWSAVSVAVISGALATWYFTREDEPKEVRGNVATGVVEIR